MVKAKAAAFVECPVGGTIGPAKEGKLFGFAGGEKADFERAKPLLDQMCRRVEHLGPAGSGASMKLAINLPLLVYWQALGEALSLVKHLNLDPAPRDGHPRRHLGRAAHAAEPRPRRSPPRSAARKRAVTVNIDTMKKDLTEMAEEAKLLGWSAPVTEGRAARLRQRLRRRPRRQGLRAAAGVLEREAEEALVPERLGAVGRIDVLRRIAERLAGELRAQGEHRAARPSC